MADEGRHIAGRYQVLDEIARGGMGVIYRVLHTLSGRKEALKLIHKELASDKTYRDRFLVEVRAVAKLTSDHTVRLYDCGATDDDGLYLTMELLRGSNLSDLIRREGAFEYRRALRLACQVCRSLEEAHGKGIIHRDLKPSNLFVTVDEAGVERLKVLDFGIARIESPGDATGLTAAGTVLGTPKYMSPEQIQGKPLDHRTDLYALGVVLYEMLTGKPPFRGEDSAAIWRRHIYQAPPRLRETNPGTLVPPGLEDMVLRCLHKAPNQRPSTATELRRALEPLLSGRAGAAISSAAALKPIESSAAFSDTLSSGGPAPTPDERPGGAAKTRRKEPYAAAVGPSNLGPGCPVEQDESFMVSTADSGAIVFLQSAWNETLDPQEVFRRDDIALIHQTHEPLLRFDPVNNVGLPCLATSWKLEGNQYHFFIRKGVLFHDGTPVTSELVAQSINRTLHHKESKALFWDVARISPVGLNEIVLETREPSGSLLARLGHWRAYISKETEPYTPGTGPFRVRSWNTGLGIVVLERNMEYWGHPARVQSIVFKTVEDEERRYELLRNEPTYLSLLSPTESRRHLSNCKSSRMIRTAFTAGVNLFINTTAPGLCELEVRKALTKTIDVPKIVDSLFHGCAVPATSFLPPGLAMRRSALPLCKFAPDAAKPILQKLGRPLSVLVMAEATPSTPDPEQLALILRQGFARADVSLVIHFRPVSEWLKEAGSEDYDLVWGGLAPDYPDPESYYFYYSRTALDVGMNLSRYDNSEFTSDLELLRRELRPRQRIEYSIRLEDHLLAQMPSVPVVYIHGLFSVGQRISGVDPPECSFGSLFPLTNVRLNQ